MSRPISRLVVVALPLAFASVAVAAPATPQLAVTGGDNQAASRTGSPSIAGFQPIMVTAVRSDGNPAPNVTVTFAWTSANPAIRCLLNPDEGQPTVSLPTDANGVATLAAMQGRSLVCSQADGVVAVAATAASYPDTAAHLVVGGAYGAIALQVNETTGAPAMARDFCRFYATAVLSQPLIPEPPGQQAVTLSFSVDGGAPTVMQIATGPNGATPPMWFDVGGGGQLEVTATTAGGASGALSSTWSGKCFAAPR